MQCREKVWYTTAWGAEQARRDMVAEKATDKSAKRLVVYHCKDCGLYHVGKLRKMESSTPVKATAEKIPTTGELRRRLKRIEERLDNELRHQAYELRKVAAADKEYVLAENEREKIRAAILADLNDSIAVAERLVVRFFSVEPPD